VQQASSRSSAISSPRKRQAMGGHDAMHVLRRFFLGAVKNVSLG
jgi:hypothetical protein